MMSEEEPAARAEDSAARAADNHTTGHTAENVSAESEAAQGPPEQGEHDEGEQVDWKAEAEKWKRAYRQAEKVNKGEAGRLNEEVSQLRHAADEREAQAKAEAGREVAAEKLRTKLARAGLSEDDANGLVAHMDTSQLVADGEASSEAIEQVAESVSRSLHRPNGQAVDTEQGQRSEESAFSADEWLRTKAQSKGR